LEGAGREAEERRPEAEERTAAGEVEERPGEEEDRRPRRRRSGRNKRG
jgi:hypothetical protein